ncbi:hypothetical protein [Kibdelosporangium philippinense]|uniref:hypothetical protein n=1 Tax=Kibdelosporangium philippinense TaxID=211113 RepID=UPI00361C82A1
MPSACPLTIDFRISVGGAGRDASLGRCPGEPAGRSLGKVWRVVGAGVLRWLRGWWGDDLELFGLRAMKITTYRGQGDTVGLLSRCVDLVLWSGRGPGT